MKQKIVAGLIGITLLAGSSVGVMESFADDESPANNRPAITEEQREAFRQKIEEGKIQFEDIQAKWDALDDEQKEELFQLEASQMDLQIEMIQKQLELGLIDEDQASDMIEALNEDKSMMRQEDRMPWGMGHHGHGRHGRFGSFENYDQVQEGNFGPGFRHMNRNFGDDNGFRGCGMNW